VIDDVVPAHTGEGPDFRLAEMRHSVFPGLYHMVQISPDDWSLLPEAPIEKDSVNLDFNQWMCWLPTVISSAICSG
jgi:hypothetical protein